MDQENGFRGKKLYRSQVNKMLGGVCGGLAEYFSIDPTLIRMVWITLFLLGGIGGIVYLVALVIIPVHPDQVPGENPEKLIKDKSLFWGSLLIVIGGFLILKNLGFFYGFQFWNLPWSTIWAVFLIAIGAYLLVNRSRSASGQATDFMGELSGRKLYRTTQTKMISGVCGGLAEYFRIDVSIVRIVWVILTLASLGMGVLAYFIMALVVPEETEPMNDNTNM